MAEANEDPLLICVLVFFIRCLSLNCKGGKWWKRSLSRVCVSRMLSIFQISIFPRIKILMLRLHAALCDFQNNSLIKVFQCAFRSFTQGFFPPEPDEREKLANDDRGFS